MAYYSLDPWGDERADLRAGIVACVIANCNRTRRGSRKFKPADFMPAFSRPNRVQSPEQMMNTMRSVIKSHNAALKRREDRTD
jgi:hypothetical protein